MDDASHVRQEIEIDRLAAALADEYPGVAHEVIDAGVRAEFSRWERSRVQDFVPIFVARSLRGRLRHRP